MCVDCWRVYDIGGMKMQVKVLESYSPTELEQAINDFSNMPYIDVHDVKFRHDVKFQPAGFNETIFYAYVLYKQIPFD